MTKKLFYTLNLTWGLPMTLIGAVAGNGANMVVRKLT